MNKSRIEQSMTTIRLALALKLRALEEAGEAATNRDCQAVVAAKIDFLAELVAVCHSGLRPADFRTYIQDELEDAQAHQRLSRNPFLVAGMQIKIGLLESVLRIADSHLPAPVKARSRSFLVPA